MQMVKVHVSKKGMKNADCGPVGRLVGSIYLLLWVEDEFYRNRTIEAEK